MLFKRSSSGWFLQGKKFWDVIVVSGTTTIVIATTRPTTTIEVTNAIATTSFSFSSTVTQQPSTKAKKFAF